MIAYIHGRGVLSFIHGEEIPGNSNLTVESVQRSLKWVHQREGTLPDTFYLQLDNFAGENKNS